MRIYTGLFSHLVSIDEEYIARVTQNSSRAVKQKLLQLSRCGVLKYIPMLRSPLMCFANERLTPSNLYLPEKVYNQRRKMFRDRLDAMMEYISQEKGDADSGFQCRSRRLSAYFGQEHCRPCGICDMCDPDGVSFLF